MGLTETQEALGAAAYRMVLHNPHIVYGTQFDRFAWTVPPNPIHADCSGAVSHVYWDGARIKIGADTGAIARDVAAGRAMWVNINALRSGDLVMRRSGRVYDGGSDEHVGMYLYHLPDGRPYTFESAGSKNGVGYYPRPSNFWRDGVRYHDLGNPELPTDVPEDDMSNTCPTFKLKGDGSDAVWFTDLQTKWWCENTDSAKRIASSGILYKPDPNKDTIVWPQVDVDQIPAAGKVPPFYAGNRA
jgi:hypothetical protein